MKRLFINDTEIDIDQSQSITLNFQCADIGELRSVGSGSQTIKLPMTAKNKVFFEHSHEINSGSVFPYLIHGARYYEDETLLIDDGNFYMLAVNDFYECCITWGNAPFLKKAEETKMGDVDLGYYRLFMPGYLVPDYALEEPLEWTLAEARFYRILDNNGVTKYYSTTIDSWDTYSINNVTVNPKYIRPHIYLKALLDKLFNYLGINYDLVNNVLKTEINNIILPQVKNTLKRNQFRINANIDKEEIVVWLNSSTLQYASIDPKPSEFLTSQLDAYQEIRFYVHKNSLYNIKIKLSYSQNHIGETYNSYPVKQSKEARFWFGIKGTDMEYTFLVPNPSISDYEIEFNNVFLREGKYNFMVHGQGYDSTLPSGSTYIFKFDVKANIVIEDLDESEISVDILNQGLFINHNALFAQESIKVLLQSVMTTFGIIPQLKDGALELFTIVDVINNISQARDWSRKLVKVTRNSYKTLKFEKKISKNNLLKWKSEKLYKNTQNGTFNAESINDESTFIDNKVFSQVDEYYHDDNLALAHDQTNIVNLNFADRNEDDPLDTAIKNYESCPKMLWAENNSLIIHLSGISSAFLGSGNSKKASFEYFNYDNPNGIRKYIQPLLNSLNKVKIVTVTMVLTPTDLQDLDFKIPIYLEQFGAYFMLNKISGYKYGGKCDVELLRLEI